MKYVDFMLKIGTIKTRPSTWKDIFFPEIHDVHGS
jgi:NitT/TauT family transport system substrate-binding protein